MRTSMRTTSGSSARAASTASNPSAASPTTSISASASRIFRKPARTSVWSSAIRTRTVTLARPRAEGGRGRRSRRRCEHLRRTRLHKRDSLAHAHEPVTCVVRFPRALSVVGDLELELPTRVADDHAGVRRPGVLEDVGESLLNDPVGRNRHPWGKRDLRTLDVELDWNPCLAHLRHQLIELGQRGLRRMGGRLVGDTQHPQQASHLRERLAAGLLDRLQCLRGDRLPASQRHPLGPGLDDHHAHAVGENVVQLAGDSRSLLG